MVIVENLLVNFDLTTITQPKTVFLSDYRQLNFYEPDRAADCQPTFCIALLVTLSDVWTWTAQKNWFSTSKK